MPQKIIDTELIPVQFIEKTSAGYRCVSDYGEELFRIGYTNISGVYFLNVEGNNHVQFFHMEGVRNPRQAKRFVKNYLDSLYLDFVWDKTLDNSES